MKITLLAIGSRGDVQPLVGLGIGLCRREHQVQVIAGDEFGSMVEAAGLEFIPPGFNIQAAISAHTDLFKLMNSLKEPILQACPPEQDAILATFMGVSACRLARERRIPFFYTVPLPGLQTGEFPNPLLPALPLGKAYNRWTYQAADRGAVRSYPDAGCLFLEPRPTYLFCFSPVLVPRPADWGAYAHVTGFWFLDQPGWQPPPGLEEFLAAEPRPIYVGFGSAAAADAPRLTRLVEEALALAGKRAVLVSGWGGLESQVRSTYIFSADSIPFDWLFPRVAAALHHGGAGTTAAALRAGIPSVFVPFGPDQAFWARRTVERGAGLGPLDPKKVSPQHLADAILKACGDVEIRQNAARLGEQIRAEDGVENAVRIIEQVAGRV